MSATTTTHDIITQMKSDWATVSAGGFHFGWEQEVDEIHLKTLPLMVINPPQVRINTKEWNSRTISNDSEWTLTVYNDIPSTYNVTDDLKILELWDDLETITLRWVDVWFNAFEAKGNDFPMTSPIQITRLKEAGNDRLLALKITFGFNFYRFCGA